MKILAQISGDLTRAMEEEREAGERAVTDAMRGAGQGLRDDWRAQVTGAGMGARLARTIRSQVYPERDISLNAAALVWTRAPKIIDAFNRGALIKSESGLFLAIPTPAAGAKGVGNKRITPGGWEQRTGLRLRLVYRPGKPGLLVAEARVNTKGRAVASRSKTGRGVATVPIFILLPQVRLPKKLDLEGPIAKWAGQLPGAIVSNWEKHA